MTDRVFQNETSFEVSNRDSSIDFEVSQDQCVTVSTRGEEAGWDSQWTHFTLTEEEAKQLVAFLVAKGY